MSHSPTAWSSKTKEISDTLFAGSVSKALWEDFGGSNAKQRPCDVYRRLSDDAYSPSNQQRKSLHSHTYPAPGPAASICTTRYLREVEPGSGDGCFSHSSFPWAYSFHRKDGKRSKGVCLHVCSLVVLLLVGGNVDS